MDVRAQTCQVPLPPHVLWLALSLVNSLVEIDIRNSLKDRTRLLKPVEFQGPKDRSVEDFPYLDYNIYYIYKYI